VFHADADGHYAKAAAMDEGNARLFGFLRTGADGRFEVRTIRPGGYPAPGAAPRVEDLIPAHLHFEVSARGHATARFQMVFADDPRMQPERWRAWAADESNPVVTPAPGPDAVLEVAHEIVLREG
jgi:protocatechuate 3,4-dioxygenase beta subunit